MADTPIEFRWFSGQTITADLVSAADAVLEAGLSATELTNGKGRYRITYTGAGTGHATLSLIVGGQYVGSVLDYILADTTAVHYPIVDFATATNAARLTEARAGALTDWTDGGRLDLILDAVLAMLDDARAEPGQGAPAVNPDAMTKLDYLYKAWRNKTTQTATELAVYADDASTVDHKATISDDGTTATKGEIATGP